MRDAVSAVIGEGGGTLIRIVVGDNAGQRRLGLVVAGLVAAIPIEETANGIAGHDAPRRPTTP
jgi:hypothetical protein